MSQRKDPHGEFGNKLIGFVFDLEGICELLANSLSENNPNNGKATPSSSDEQLFSSVSPNTPSTRLNNRDYLNALDGGHKGDYTQ